MSVFKLFAKGGIVISALIILSGCSGEELVQNKYKKVNDSTEVELKKNSLKKITETSAQTSRVIARVMSPKVLLKKSLDRVENLIGKANFLRKEGNAVVLQYKKDWCILDIFFYGPEGRKESTYYEFRSREKTGVNTSECINKMIKN